MGSGSMRILVAAMPVNRAGCVQLTILLPVITMDMPVNAVWVANVTRNAGMLKVVTMKPWKRPASSPTATAARMSTKTEPGVAPRALMTSTQTTPVRPSNAPIERSMPPIRKTKIVPQTMMPMTDTEFRTDPMLETFMKLPPARSHRTTMNAMRMMGLL